MAEALIYFLNSLAEPVRAQSYPSHARAHGSLRPRVATVAQSPCSSLPHPSCLLIARARFQIFPPSVVDQYSEGTNLSTFCRQSLLLLTPAHYNAFIYLVSFLRECLKHADSNKLSPAQLVLVFAGCLMHCHVDGTDGAEGGAAAAASSSSAASAGAVAKESKPKAWVILRHFLTSEEFV